MHSLIHSTLPVCLFGLLTRDAILACKEPNVLQEVTLGPTETSNKVDANTLVQLCLHSQTISNGEQIGKQEKVDLKKPRPIQKENNKPVLVGQPKGPCTHPGVLVVVAIYM